MITATPRYMRLAATKLYNITVTSAIHPDSTADQCVVMAMGDDRTNTTGKGHAWVTLT